MEQSQRENQVFELVALAGEVLLASGAEISRVIDTMQRISAAYGCNQLDCFVVSNGVLLSTGGGGRQYQAKVSHIPLGSSRLDRINSVNQLSREISAGQHTPEQAYRQLQEIAQMPVRPVWYRSLCCSIGSGAFGYVFGGSALDAVACGVGGLLLFLYLQLLVRRRLSKIALHMSGGALATLISMALMTLGLGEHLPIIIAGSVAQLLPGMAFTNAIRDIADENYISGSVRMLDVILVIVCLASGVYFAGSLVSSFAGGELFGTLPL
ncbi:MAG: threonine/serine exporter family protein [Candidatus Fournierella pullistercoris]|uniref:Threonine/serine exporter family protein n=1 Tax=Candidatus Allofournierella pullistercoris TaxID=2838597 RepID=A0A948T140_9FIRM|nr:threonine/serine exporter family protein [Candidatus Fournierella pullistercoris]